MAPKDIQDADVNTFLEQFGRKRWWSAVQKWWTYDGEAGYSKVS